MSRKITVLIVEDNKLCLFGARCSLEQAGCSVDTAETGKEGLDKAVKNKYDIIFMDIGLEKGTDGFEVTKKIRSTSQINKDTPVVALTAHNREDYKEKAKEVGMNDFMVKPADVDKVKSIIKDFGLSEN